MKKKKKNIEPIVINQEPLSTTTIGKIEVKENGPIFALVGIGIFVVCILLLPQLSEWVSNLSTPSTPSIVTPGGGGSTIPAPDDDDDTSEIRFYDLSNDLLIVLNGFNFSNFLVDEGEETLSFTITNQNGDSDLFVKNNYYMELYTADELLLQRIRLTTDTLNGSQTFSYDISESVQNGTISKITVVSKVDEDYPQVELELDANNVPILTCQKNNEILTYRFVLENNVYHLIEINERNSYLSRDENYSKYLQEYTTLSNLYLGIVGVSTSLNPTATGFSFDTTINLEKISVAEYKRVFEKNIYYSRNTEARVIAFELSASGYTCS